MLSTISPAFLLLLAVLANQAGETEAWAFSRRQAIASTAAAASAAILQSPVPANHVAVAAAPPSEGGGYEFRDRKSNKEALVREDYYYMMGKTPPRSLKSPLKLDNPEWNTFGSCETSEGGTTNSCTYVSLKQRISAYSKYFFNINLGAKEYMLLGKALRDASAGDERGWTTAASYLTTPLNAPPPPPVDALLKMVLFASALLTSPNYSGPTKEVFVARFYANEVNFANKEIVRAIEDRDATRALDAWEFGKDSWNSYFQVVNGKIVPKMGDKFELMV